MLSLHSQRSYQQSNDSFMVKNMPLGYHFNFDTVLHLLNVEVSGNYSLHGMKKMVTELREHCHKVNCFNVIVNVATLTEAVNDMDRYELGVYVSEIFKQDIRLGVLDRKERINYFFETVAINRFTDVKVSHDIDELIAWLGKGK